MKSSLFGLVLVCGAACIAAQIGGSVTTNPAGGVDANIAAVKRFGDENANIGGGVFAQGNTNKGPVTTGAFLDANKNGHGISLQHKYTPGFGSETSQNARVNLFDDKTHKFDANAFHSRTHMDNGFKYDRIGTGLNYNHVAGHEASLTASRIPQLDINNVGLMGKANLWSSPNRQTTLDLTGTASHTFGGSIKPRTDFGAGLGLTHWFG